MKKLIIAAGIAAATMASFNASANTYDKSSLSHASVNSQVTGSSVVTVGGTNGRSYSTTDILNAGNDLGSFSIVLPVNALGFGISGIHSHGFPDGFKAKFNTCKVTVQAASGGNMKSDVDSNDLIPVRQECVFDNSVTKVDVTTEVNTVKVAPGTKTITADFTAYTS